MKNLIFKEIQFNKKNVILSVIIPLVSTILIGFDNGNYGLMAFYMSWILSFNFFVGKSCYADEQGSTLNYLKTLPIKVGNIVNIKFFLTLTTMIQGWGIVYISNFMLTTLGRNGHVVNYKLIILLLSIHLLYCGLYLYLFYRFNYSATQYSFFVVFVVLLLTKMLGSNKYLDITNIHLNRFLPYIVITLALFLFIVLWKLSKNAFSRRVI